VSRGCTKKDCVKRVWERKTEKANINTFSNIDLVLLRKVKLMILLAHLEGSLVSLDIWELLVKIGNLFAGSEATAKR
jgi:hypothetical protein